MNQPRDIQENVSLAAYTTFKIGGNAKFFLEAKNDAQIIEAILWAKKNGLPLFVLGGGSNLLISDEGLAGFVLHIATKGIESFNLENNYTNVIVQAGENWDDFVEYCVGQKYQGIECLSGIPGTVGASPVQNIGAYGQEVSSSIINVKCFDRKTETMTSLTADECEFAYRSSVFNTTAKNRYIILAVEFKFSRKDFSDSVYKDLRNVFGNRKPNLSEMREVVLNIRRAKSMVIDENDFNSKSAGSFFKNPIVTIEKYVEINRLVKTSGIENIPSFAVDNLSVKIPAAWLIENSGFQKGYKLGQAGISENHALALVNLGNARAADIVKLKEKIQAEVKKRFGIELQPEPIFVGFKE